MLQETSLKTSSLVLYLRESAASSVSLVKKSVDDKKTNSLDDAEVDKTTANASLLGVYSKADLKSKGLKILANESQDALVDGNANAGRYTLRTIYLEDGTYLYGGENLSGRFVVNSLYRVRGQPSQEIQNSSVGQYPVNGQYRYQGAYPRQIQQTDDYVSNGQYSVGTKDPLQQSFATSGVVQVQGKIIDSNPYFITDARFRNGRYQVQVDSLKGTALQVNGQDVQRSGESVENGQLLVNGLNRFLGKYRTMDQFSSKAEVMIDGSYDSSSGKYLISGKTLENGSNLVSGSYSVAGQTFPVEVYVQGRYTSGGQYVISTLETDSVKKMDSSSSNTSSFDWRKKLSQAYGLMKF